MGDFIKYCTALVLFVVAACVASIAFTLVAAAIASSDNYQITETEFGAGSAIESCSGQYCARASIGSIGPEQKTRSPGFATFSEFSDGDEPRLEVIVEEGESNLGILSTDKTASKEAVVKILSYMSEGYTLQLIGEPPKYNDHVLKTPSTPTNSTPGTEQFAINVVKNTTPEVGADPLQVPSGEFSFGQVEDNYQIANKFMFNSGDVLARSLTESGQTEYTISMIVNIANTTPAGHFAGDFAAVVIPAF